MVKVESAPAPAARHVSRPVRVVLPEVQQARRSRLLIGSAIIVGLTAVTMFSAALVWTAVPA